MKRVLSYILIIVFLASFGSVTYAQNKDKDSKKERKKERLRKLKAINNLVKVRTWVLEAHTLIDRDGDSFHISDMINFVYVIDSAGTIQLGFDNLVGYNGVGGITLKGEVTKYKVYENNDNNTISVLANLFGSTGYYTMRLYPSVYNSRIEISGNFGGRVTLLGDIVHPEQSKVYEGHETF